MLILSCSPRYKSSVLILKKIYFRVLLTASKSRYFAWTEDHDVLMLGKAVTSEPYNLKPKSSERGKVWESIAAYLNSLKSPEFRVTARAVRDRYALLIFRHKLWIMSPFLHGYESRFSSMQRPSSPSQTKHRL